MLNLTFVATVAVGLLALLSWGVRTLPGERWQMLAAVPVAKAPDGSWRGVNLTFYGFFSATGPRSVSPSCCSSWLPSVSPRESLRCLHC